MSGFNPWRSSTRSSRRSDRGSTKLPAAVQERLLAAKQESPRRSIRVLRQMLEREGLVPRGVLSRSAIHRFLRQHGASRPPERRSFLAERAGDILCREFDISRKTGYKLFSRYKDCGLEGLTDRSRRPYWAG
jgi:hypothetical protein